MPEAAGRAVERVLPVLPLPTSIDPFRTDEDDLLPQSVVKLYREQLDDDGLDFLKRGPRSTAERLAFAQRVHPAAYRTAERLSEDDQRRFEAHGEIDSYAAFVGPDGVVYRRNGDSDESLAARIRRGFETAVGGYDRSDPVRLLAAGRPVTSVSEDRSVAQGADDGQPVRSDRESTADRREWRERPISDNPAETAPSSSPQRTKWLPKGVFRSSPGGEGHPVIFEYLNGDQYVARNSENDERLLVRGDKPLVIQADEAEQLGLAEWMPYTRPEPEAQVYVPSSPPPIRGRRQILPGYLGAVAKYFATEIPDIVRVLDDVEGKIRAQELYTPRE
ncbi:hypothetical protein [Rhodospirillaceae bacterium SYSU D60014]|uniref:hypothetical protein n=1 Tax=Virgifigura deserti TaxID=2268457 RepID=UPI0013C45AB5